MRDDTQHSIRPITWTRRIAAAALPDVWRIFDDTRARLLAEGRAWPGYMWMPFDEVSRQVSVSMMRHLRDHRVPPQTITSLLPFVAVNAYTMASWRLGKGIYRFDPDLFAALVDTPVTGDIPTEALRRIPEWGVYIETPSFHPSESDVHGFFACLSRQNGNDVLFLSVDMTEPSTSRLIPFIPIDLRHRTIEEALYDNVRKSVRATSEMQQRGIPVNSTTAESINKLEDLAELDNSVVAALRDVGPLLSLLLYLCADDRDLSSDPPPLPESSQTKRGTRFFAAPQSRLVGVGLRLGARLREARLRVAEPSKERALTVIPHLRRAHWHTFLYGPRSRAQERRLRWVHPVLVNDHDRREDAPAVLHPVVRSTSATPTPCSGDTEGTQCKPPAWDDQAGLA